MPTKRFTLQTSGESPTPERLIEVGINAVIDAIDDQIGAIATGLEPAGGWSAIKGHFPSGAVKGTYYIVSEAGTVDGQAFAVGDWLVPLTPAASVSRYEGHWFRADYSKIVRNVCDDVFTLGASMELPRGENALWQTKDGFNFIEVSSYTAEPHLTTEGGAALRYVPGQEVNVLGLRSVEDGGDISKTLRRAATAFPGKLLRLPPGSYSAASPLEIGDLPAALIRADGAEITVEENVPFLRAGAPSWEKIQGIAPVNGEAFWGSRSTISCSDGSAYVVGDLVKVVSDDKQRCTRKGEMGREYRRGFMAYVTAISGNELTLDRPVPWSLVNHPRIGRMPRRYYQWKGGRIRYEAGHEADWRGNAMILSGVSDLDIEVEVEHTYNAAVRVLGCMDARVNAVGRDLRNDQFNRQFGYLVEDGSQGTRASVVAGRSRHGYTTSQPLIGAGLDALDLYGATYGALVTGQSHGNTQAGFDTHHGSENITFSNVVVSGAMTANSIVLRGMGHRVICPQVYNSKDGICVYTEKGVETPTQAEIISPNVDVDRTALKFMHADIRLSGSGCLRSRKYGHAVILQGGELTIRGSHDVRPGGSEEVDGRCTMELAEAQVDACEASLLFDLRDVPNNLAHYGIVGSRSRQPSRWTGGRLRVIHDAGMTTLAHRLNSDASEIRFGGGLELITERNEDRGMNVGGADFVGPWSWHPEVGGGTRDIFSDIGENGAVPKWSNRSDPVVSWRLRSAGTYELGALPDGTFPGQLLVTSCTKGTLTLKHGLKYNTALGGSDIIMEAGTGTVLTWNGINWLRVGG